MHASTTNTSFVAIVATGLLLASPASAQRGACSATAWVGANACRFDVRDDRWEGVGICLNESDPEAVQECLEELAEELAEASEECDEVYEARLDLCEAVGEAPYDPPFDPADFDSDFANPTQPNPWYPLGIGNTWDYEGGDENIHIVVENATKLIEGVTCITVNDVAREEGVVLEDTDDWIALALDGSVHYCGEIAQNFEIFEGDVPDDPELVDVEGSWKTGRDGAKPGVLMQANPQVGQLYRQEFAFGDAEDAGEVLSTDYDFATGGELNAHVPQALAELLCDGDCVVTRDFTPLEPDANERKYYAPGLGLFLEVEVDSGDTVQLVDCNFDARCAVLPQP